MAVVGVLPTTSAVDTTSTSDTPVKDPTTLDKDAFLQLLVAQLKYQNPLSPADPTQFMSQTAQFTMVEQLQNMAKDQATSALAQQLSTASSLVGKQITWVDTDGTSKTGVVSAAQLSGGATTLTVGKDAVPIGSVSGIAPAPAAVAAPVTGDDGTGDS
jgi:flagellar basal-body rod modification protein FlgD